jgi:DNA-binding transcriptional regulator YiaG
LERETFPYGDEAIEISAVVPVLRCDACGFVFTDQRAEKERHRAVCEHLGLLPPARIQHIRKAVLGMSRDVFHAAYGLSAASVERWENGKLIQGEAADTLIRALEDPTLAKRLDRRKTDSPSESHTAGDNVIWARFPSLGKRQARADDALARSKDFNLRINAC